MSMHLQNGTCVGEKYGELNIQDALRGLVLFQVVTVDTMNVSAVARYPVKTSSYFVQHASIKALL